MLTKPFTSIPFSGISDLLSRVADQSKNIVTSNMLPSLQLAGAVGVGIGVLAGSFVTRHLMIARSTSSTRKSLASRPTYTPPGGSAGDIPTSKINQALLPSPDFGKKVHIFDPSKLKSCYNLVISTVTPRPIALVSSRNKETGIDNVAPFSYFGAVAHDPPMLAIGFCRKGSAMKDSLVNILSSKQFAVNIISAWYLDAANHSCGMFPPEIDEFEMSGLTKVNDCEAVDAPRVKEAAVTYECKLEYVHPVVNAETNEPTTEIVLCRVVRIHVDETVLEKNEETRGFDLTRPVVDTIKLQPMGRLGGNIFCTIGETVDIPRPKV